MSKFRFKIEMLVEPCQREVNADSFAELDGWLIFYRDNPQGGPAKEYWRAQREHVVCMETQREPKP